MDMQMGNVVNLGDWNDADGRERILAGAQVTRNMIAERDGQLAELRQAVDAVLNMLAMAKKKTPKDELLSLIEMAKERLQEVEA